MKIHSISDDGFFSLGCEAIFNINGYKLNSIPPERSWLAELNEEIGEGDIVLVTMGSHLRTQKVLERLSCIGAEVMLFIDLPGKTFSSVSWMRGFLSKKIPISLLLPSFETISFHTGNKTKLLTQREKEVMEEILKGQSFKQISETLNISLKTVYAHRRNSLKKIGLGHASSFSFVGYQNYIANNSIKLISY
ncbi:Transcriptional regulatory protein UhpA [compost metagenome]